MFPLVLKGRFKATFAVLYIAGTFYARYFGTYLPLCLNHYYNIIKEKLYANHMSSVNASLYDTKGEFMCYELEALNAVGGAEHAYFLYISYCGWS